MAAGSAAAPASLLSGALSGMAKNLTSVCVATASAAAAVKAATRAARMASSSAAPVPSALRLRTSSHASLQILCSPTHASCSAYRTPLSGGTKYASDMRT